MMDDILVGLEIHQQLDTGSKLFCRCTGVREPGRVESFVRRLRPVRSEMGGYDPAALFEESRDKTILYRADVNNSCMVERDEEPPREVDHMSKRAALVVAAALESSVFEEVYPMRKTVIDGSNTGGFQRTMLVSRGGRLRVGDAWVGVQSICLEEDSARPLGEEDDMKVYALDRLGIPLVEIALEPIPGDPKAVRRVAEALGRLLRGTRMVARGIGTIRQDVNVSVRGGGGIVEVKGVQYLDQLEKVIEYEGMRQAGLLSIRDAIRERDLAPPGDGDVFDMTGMMGGCGSDIIQRALRRGDRIRGVRLRGYAGILGMEPRPGIRLGRELGQIVKYYGIGGVFHTDELPGYGIGEGEVASLYGHMGADPDTDALVLVAAPPAAWNTWYIPSYLGWGRPARACPPRPVWPSSPGVPYSCAPGRDRRGCTRRRTSPRTGFCGGHGRGAEYGAHPLGGGGAGVLNQIWHKCTAGRAAAGLRVCGHVRGGGRGDGRGGGLCGLGTVL